MKTVSVRDVRNSFSMLEAWLAEGEEICIERRGQPIGLLKAWKGAAASRRAGLPDFAGRRKAIWGNRMFTEDEVASMRTDERTGDEG